MQQNWWLPLIGQSECLNKTTYCIMHVFLGNKEQTIKKNSTAAKN